MVGGTVNAPISMVGLRTMATKKVKQSEVLSRSRSIQGAADAFLSAIAEDVPPTSRKDVESIVRSLVSAAVFASNLANRGGNAHPELWERVGDAGAAITRTQGIEQKRARVLDAVGYLLKHWKQPNLDKTASARGLLSKLQRIDPAFAGLEVWVIIGLLDAADLSGKGGRVQRGLNGIAAKLSVACNAFSDRAIDHDEAKCLKRSAKRFEKVANKKAT